MTPKQIVLKKRTDAQTPVINATQDKHKNKKFDNTPKSTAVNYKTFKKTEEEKLKLKQLKKECVNPSVNNRMIFQF